MAGVGAAILLVVAGCSASDTASRSGAPTNIAAPVSAASASAPVIQVAPSPAPAVLLAQASAASPAPESVSAAAAPASVADSATPLAAKPERPEAVIPADVSPTVAEVAKLAQAHVSDDVILAYIRTATTVYKPSANEIVFLSDLGVKDAVLTELVTKGKESFVATTAEESADPVASSAALASVPGAAAAPTAPSYSVVAAAPAPVVSVVAAAPAEPAITVDYFHSALSPYGSWVLTEDYGWCWQPTVAASSPDWMPYCDRGHWVYTDRGWYWESEYSWGWAPFHYGRWWRHPRHGWVWYPDTMWGPSWVCWRNQDAYCGWAPLPPAARFEVGIGLTFHHGLVSSTFDFGLGEGAFIFVGVGHFMDPHPGRFRPSHGDFHRIYGESVVVNHYGMVNRTMMVNVGFGRERITHVTHQEINPVVIRHVSGPNTPEKMEHLDRGGHAITVYHPPVVEAGRGAPAKSPVVINHPAYVRPASPSRVEPQGRGSAPAGHPAAPSRSPEPAQRAAPSNLAPGKDHQPSSAPARSSAPAQGSPEKSAPKPEAGKGAVGTTPTPQYPGSPARTEPASSSRPAGGSTTAPTGSAGTGAAPPRTQPAPTVAPDSHSAAPGSYRATPAVRTAPATAPRDSSSKTKGQKGE